MAKAEFSSKLREEFQKGSWWFKFRVNHMPGYAAQSLARRIYAEDQTPVVDELFTMAQHTRESVKQDFRVRARARVLRLSQIALRNWSDGDSKRYEFYESLHTPTIEKMRREIADIKAGRR